MCAAARWTPLAPALALLALSCGGGPGSAPPSRDAGADATADARRPADASGPGRDARSSDAPVEADASKPDRPVTCSDGSPLAYSRTTCPGAPGTVPAGLASAVASAARGGVFDLSGVNPDMTPCFPVNVCVPSGAPTLLFSDEPESPSSDGILYADVIGPGAFRVYVYHTNAGSGLRKFPVVVLNQGTMAVHATLGRIGIAGPSTDYIATGKQAVRAWLASTGTKNFVVPPGERVLLDGELDAVHAATNELAHGIIDFTLDGPVKLSVVSVPASADAAAVTAGLPLLGNTGMHLRGTFPGAALTIESASPMPAGGVTHIQLGGGATDVPLSGHDAVDGTTVTLQGDYGVPYTLRLRGATDTALFVSPRGGAWGGSAEIGAGLDGPASLTDLPAGSDALGSTQQAVFLGRFGGSAVAGIELLSAGGSSLPVAIGAVPVTH